MARLTDAGRRALRGARDYDNVGMHFHGMSEHGGLTSATIPYLVRNGWLDTDLQITPAGLQLLADLEHEGDR